ncbi:Hypothetical predicted protein [Cloeon dipterum]|uniref:Exoribonuclease phosphorolytic domain-containing protein n=1 Tax=Cloeon dipterum TaxID=197152 RepID=A0A8S1CZE9_9INSE|nr:Hypothetical predicted protein [Cloeon dipterum]
MPVDHRRIQGPECSEDYRKPKTLDAALLKKGSRRADGRKCGEQRKIFLKPGVVSQAKGSAYIELDHTKVICSVFDPREKASRNLEQQTVRGEIFCEFKFASFSGVQRRSHQQEADDKEYSLLLKNALEPAVCLHEFPNFQVDVQVLVLQDDGSSLAAAITCAGLALADAAVPMYDLPVGLSKAFSGDTEFFDPTGAEERMCLRGVDGESDHGVFTIGFLPTFNQVSQLFHSGHISSDRFGKMISEVGTLAAEVHKAVQAILLSAVKSSIDSSDNSKLLL